MTICRFAAGEKDEQVNAPLLKEQVLKSHKHGIPMPVRHLVSLQCGHHVAIIMEIADAYWYYRWYFRYYGYIIEEIFPSRPLETFFI